MPAYIAMLRGVNLGPHNRMKMEKLRDSLEALGFTQVQTYIQSGNVVFATGKTSPLALMNKMEAKILADFGLSVSVITTTAAEMNTVIQNNPFLEQRGIDRTKLHVTFLSETPRPPALEKLTLRQSGPDKFHCSGKSIYLYCPNGYGQTKLTNGLFERVLSVRATTRNWNTVNKLHEMARACS